MKAHVVPTTIQRCFVRLRVSTDDAEALRSDVLDIMHFDIQENTPYGSLPRIFENRSALPFYCENTETCLRFSFLFIAIQIIGFNFYKRF